MSDRQQDMDAAMDAIRVVVEHQMMQRAVIIETACEKALQGGTNGVLVIEHTDASGSYVAALPDPSVPYGTIHYRTLP